MKRVMMVENKKARAEFDLQEITISQIQGMYNSLSKCGLTWETKEFRYASDNYNQMDCDC